MQACDRDPLRDRGGAEFNAPRGPQRVRVSAKREGSDLDVADGAGECATTLKRELADDPVPEKKNWPPGCLGASLSEVAAIAHRVAG